VLNVFTRGQLEVLAHERLGLFELAPRLLLEAPLCDFGKCRSLRRGERLRVGACLLHSPERRLTGYMTDAPTTTSDEVVLITGPQWVPQSYFDFHYRPRIVEALARGATFVVGAAAGVDAMAQRLLASEPAMTTTTNVVVYDKGTKDGRLSENFVLRNGFLTYPERDAAMAKAATSVICVLPQMGGGVSGALAPALTVVYKNEHDLRSPSAHLEAVRRLSEPYDEAIVARVRAIYDEHYSR
jgi:hypothetical protein